MSELFSNAKSELKFVRKHLKLTHCDIFFADGVIFVEGQAERLLIPEFIAQISKELSKRYISILEVSGAHTHKYRELVEKLGIATLIITDLDSVDTTGKKCPPARGKKHATCNVTLKSWCPEEARIDELVDLRKEACERSDSGAPLYVAYQKPIKIGGTEVLSRTFEDALILSNFSDTFFSSMPKIKTAKECHYSGSIPLAKSLFDFVNSITKGDFAFSCLFHLADKEENTFTPPKYVRDGLVWLEKQLSPNGDSES